MEIKQTRKVYSSQIIMEWVSTLGDMLFYPVFIAFAVALEKSTVFLALITVSEYFPYVLTSFFGMRVDKTKNKLGLMFGATCTQAVLYCLLSITLLGVADANDLLMIFMIILNFVSGCLNKITNASSLALVLNLIHDDNELKRYRLISVAATSVVQIVGQLFGAIGLAMIGAAGMGFINSLTFILPLILVLKFLNLFRISQEELCECVNDSQNIGFWKSVREVFKNKLMCTLLFFAGGINFALIPLASLFMPKLLQEMPVLPFDNLTIAYGIAAVVFGVFTAVGVFLAKLISAKDKKLLIFMLCLILCTAILYGIMSFVNAFYQMLIVAAVFAVQLGVFNVLVQTYFFGQIPSEKAGFYNGVMQTVTMGTGIISTLCATPLIQICGIRMVFVIYAIFLTLLSTIGVVLKVYRV